MFNIDYLDNNDYLNKIKFDVVFIDLTQPYIFNFNLTDKIINIDEIIKQFNNKKLFIRIIFNKYITSFKHVEYIYNQCYSLLYFD